MKYLVLLAGCGLGDGSCIEEVILTYVALDKYGCDYTPVAEDVSIQSVNHLTEEMAEKRNILIEAARIGRGRIKDIHEVDFAEYDALIIPGGIDIDSQLPVFLDQLFRSVDDGCDNFSRYQFLVSSDRGREQDIIHSTHAE